ncbi:helix-turn-helix domain-containing protein [Anatilimnocola floriformis]|uniref:helix-turn-helix domain-containing protein n=1 Tax=Anatilimnocola floriformis TaxID=2948575 RepID=UPI0020C59C0E|nr:helix-turn-helix domain-containing protein [Anatilimnocola floriformis]
MPRALALAVRRAIWRRSKNGQSVALIAQELELCERTVRSFLQRLRARGEAALAANYQACGRERSQDAEVVRRRTLRLREQHRRWGAERLRIELTRWFVAAQLPSTRTLQRWLRTTRPAPSGRRQGTRVTRAEQPHHVWQIDAAEQKRLASGAPVSWLRVADECSGAVLMSFVFSPRSLHAGSRGSRAGLFAAGF